ncbi:MAG TPA: hypothetical protein PLA68_03020 [Panacibacter sp.]|nr:hypothetical protein [Panacibacter sp.]
MENTFLYEASGGLFAGLSGLNYKRNSLNPLSRTFIPPNFAAIKTASWNTA